MPVDSDAPLGGGRVLAWHEDIGREWSTVRLNTDHEHSVRKEGRRYWIVARRNPEPSLLNLPETVFMTLYVM